MQSMPKALEAHNNDMRFASPDAGPGDHSLKKTQTPPELGVRFPCDTPAGLLGKQPNRYGAQSRMRHCARYRIH
jgi:hypothetical protein